MIALPLRCALSSLQFRPLFIKSLNSGIHPELLQKMYWCISGRRD